MKDQIEETPFMVLLFPAMTMQTVGNCLLAVNDCRLFQFFLSLSLDQTEDGEGEASALR